MKRFLTILIILASLSGFAQNKTFRTGVTGATDTTSMIVYSVSDGAIVRIGMASGADTAWFVWDGNKLNVIAPLFLLNDTTISSGGGGGTPAELGNWSFDADSILNGTTQLYVESGILHAAGMLAADNLTSATTPQYSIVIGAGEEHFAKVPYQGFRDGENILRVPVVGEPFAGYYFAPPTMSISLSPSTTVYEVGTSNSITISGTVSNPGSATLSNGELVELNAPTTVTTFADNTTYSSPILFEPQQGGSANYEAYTYRFQANQDWVSAAESGNVTSSTKTIYGVFPVFYFTSDQDYTSGNVNIQTLEGAGETIYSLVEREGDKSVAFSSVADSYAYFLFPQTWVDETFSSIKDPNGFETKDGWSYTTITVTNSTKYTAESYKCVRTNLLSTYTDSPVYIFKQ